MITKTKLVKYITTDKTEFESIEAARQHELTKYLLGCENPSLKENAVAIADALNNDPERIADILTMNASSRPAARKVNGGKRKKKAVTAPIAEYQATPPGGV